MEKYDIAVIGAGPGGIQAALASDQAGFKTILIEKDFPGGTCLHSGCIPTKALLASSKFFTKILKSDQYGIQKTLLPIPNLPLMQSQKNAIVQNLRKALDWRLEKSNVTLSRGQARLNEKRQILIKGKETVDAENIILATGSSPKPFPGIPFDRQKILSSTDILSLPCIPKSLVIIGGGTIGVEFASFYQALGTQVTIVEALSRLISFEDPDVSKRLELAFRKNKIQIKTDAHVMKIQPEAEAMRILLEGGEVIHGEYALVAIGRERNTKNLGLEELNLRFEGTAIHVNSFLETSVPHLFAIGDLINAPQLAHAASYEAELIVRNLKSKEKEKIRYDMIPNVIFSDPQIASIGLTSEKACGQKLNPRELKIPLTAGGKAWIERESDGFMKLIVDMPSKQILGAHLIGGDAPELIGILSLAIQKEMTAHDLARIVFPHPTYSELIGELARELANLSD